VSIQRAAVLVLVLLGACKGGESSTQEKDLDVQLAQAKAQTEADDMEMQNIRKGLEALGRELDVVRHSVANAREENEWKAAEEQLAAMGKHCVELNARLAALKTAHAARTR
jgi:hypothetical protein